ncbi:DUF3397 family protein [Sporosarcina sp. FSL K6-3457]|uniref:DUF3397 family protein n=1 Tax=Sporosarcina sp. FSL K6-3457 TaxID=2978204 RepID=UPI0030F4E10A
MNGITSTFFGGVILFPFIVTVLFLIIMRRMGKAPASVIGLAADVTTPFLFLTVYVASRTIIGEGTGVYIIGAAIIIAIARIVMERVKVKEFQIAPLLRKTWRLYFLVLTVGYILLLLGGVIAKVIDYIT